MSSVPGFVRILIAAIAFHFPINSLRAQSDEEARRLVDDYVALESTCDAAMIRRFVVDRVVGRLREEALGYIDRWVGEDRLKSEDECRRRKRTVSPRLTQIERDVDLSGHSGRAERGTSIFYDRFDEQASQLGGTCLIVVVQIGGEWKFVDAYCLSPGMPPHPAPRQ